MVGGRVAGRKKQVGTSKSRSDAPSRRSVADAILVLCSALFPSVTSNLYSSSTEIAPEAPFMSWLRSTHSCARACRNCRGARDVRKREWARKTDECRGGGQGRGGQGRRAWTEEGTSSFSLGKGGGERRRGEEQGMARGGEDMRVDEGNGRVGVVRGGREGRYPHGFFEVS